MEAIFSITDLQRNPSAVKTETTYEARLDEAIGRGIADIEAGRYTNDINDAFLRADKIRIPTHKDGASAIDRHSHLSLPDFQQRATARHCACPPAADCSLC